MNYTVEQQERLIAYLATHITPNKVSKIDHVLLNRTDYVTVVLEDIYQPHNASAVLRSAECFGVQNVHVIENKHQFRVSSGVALGSSKWLNIIRYNDPENNNTQVCIDRLKQQGYSIVATTPDNYDYLLPDMPLDNKLAFLFGTEHKGLTSQVFSQADVRVKIPMFGFTQSFNISVCVAILLQSVISNLHASSAVWQLTYRQILDIKLDWMRKILLHADVLERQFFNDSQEK